MLQADVNSLHCGASTWSQSFVFFSFGSSVYLLGCTVAAVSAHRLAEMSKTLYKISRLSGRPTVYVYYYVLVHAVRRSQDVPGVDHRTAAKLPAVVDHRRLKRDDTFKFTPNIQSFSRWIS